MRLGPHLRVWWGGEERYLHKWGLRQAKGEGLVWHSGEAHALTL